jgi:hypothetical protein
MRHVVVAPKAPACGLLFRIVVTARKTPGEHFSVRAPEPGWLSPILKPITEVRAGEAVTALLLTANAFLLLAAYYLIKPVREALILALASGAEYKSYLGAAIAVLLLLAVPLYARAFDRYPRGKLVVGVSCFFALHLVAFFALGMNDAVKSRLGLAFFVWVGVFNMMVVAQLLGLRERHLYRGAGQAPVPSDCPGRLARRGNRQPFRGRADPENRSLSAAALGRAAALGLRPTLSLGRRAREQTGCACGSVKRRCPTARQKSFPGGAFPPLPAALGALLARLHLREQ